MISFILPADGMTHLMRHFSDSAELGSRFFFKSPVSLLAHAATCFPDKFIDAVADNDGRKRISVTFDHEIGTCNVVPLSSLTEQERASLFFEDRDGYKVKVAFSDRTFPTSECQIILAQDNTVITLFPGPLAPPFPKPGESSNYWDNHVFIRQKE